MSSVSCDFFRAQACRCFGFIASYFVSENTMIRSFRVGGGYPTEENPLP